MLAEKMFVALRRRPWKFTFHRAAPETGNNGQASNIYSQTVALLLPEQKPEVIQRQRAGEAFLVEDVGGEGAFAALERADFSSMLSFTSSRQAMTWLVWPMRWVRSIA